MKILDLDARQECGSVPEGAVLLLGCFDGVHRGHRALFDEAVRLAQADANGKRAVCVYTFHAMPKTENRLLTDPSEKCRLFREFGARYAVFEDFAAVRTMEGEDFLTDLTSRFSPSALVCGFNYRFGRGAGCSADDLTRFGQAHGIETRVLPPCTVCGRTVSSTAIRTAVEEGDLPLANALLGRPYSVTAPIRHGKEIGRTIGYPTVNQRLPEGKLCPPRGVYRCTVTLSDGSTYGGVCNIGSRPTVNANESDVTLETHLFGFSGDLYGTEVTVGLEEFLRPERKFRSLAELETQIQADCTAAGG